MLSKQEIQNVAIIPAFNEANTIGSVVNAALQSKVIDAVIVVDDGSTDNTQDKARNAACINDTNKPFDVVKHDNNKGKTEALISGIEQPKELGSVSFSTIVFLDADSSPIWSRDTKNNMKLWQIAINKVAKMPTDYLDEESFLEREPIFIALLARYIDEIASPVVLNEIRMRMGMYERNVVTDTILTVSNWGGHAGNRAIRIKDWDNLLKHVQSIGITLSGWEIEAALNTFIPKNETSSFIMRGVVNVGSRRKAGSTVKGLVRMTKIHTQALKATSKLR